MKTDKIIMIAMIAIIMTVTTGLASADTYIGKSVYGAQCSDEPAQQGMVPSAVYINTLTYDCGGADACVYQFFDAGSNTVKVTNPVQIFKNIVNPSKWGSIFKDEQATVGVSEIPLMKGDKINAPYNAMYFKRYDCFNGIIDQEEQCGDWSNQECGGDINNVMCDSFEILQTRTCSRSVLYGGDYIEGRCTQTSQCSSPSCEPSVSEWSSCEDGQRTRVKKTSDCRTYTERTDCAYDCENPTSRAGTYVCDSQNREYVCDGSTGKWAEIGTCAVDDSGSSGGSGSGDPGSGGGNLQKPKIELIDTQAIYNDQTEEIIGRATIKNTGGKMFGTYLLEMAVEEQGAEDLAFVSDQKLCDKNHPENVHRMYLLDSGEQKTLEFRVDKKDLPSANAVYDITLLSARKCYADLSSEEKAKGDSYQKVGPAPGGKNIAEITIGNPNTTSYMLYGGLGLMAVGLALSFLGLFPWSLIPFGIGLVMTLIGII